MTWPATDASGNTASAFQSVTVQDTTPPVVTPPADITVEATGPTTAVALGTATATDIVDVALTPTPNQTGPFGVGVHTIVWSAADSAGNTGTANQTVTVTDTTPPETTILSAVDENGNPLSDGALTPSTALTFTFEWTDIVGVVGFE